MMTKYHDIRSFPEKTVQKPVQKWVDFWTPPKKKQSSRGSTPLFLDFSPIFALSSRFFAIVLPKCYRNSQKTAKFRLDPASRCPKSEVKKCILTPFQNTYIPQKSQFPRFMALFKKHPKSTKIDQNPCPEKPGKHKKCLFCTLIYLFFHRFYCFFL